MMLELAKQLTEGGNYASVMLSVESGSAFRGNNIRPIHKFTNATVIGFQEIQPSLFIV